MSGLEELVRNIFDAGEEGADTDRCISTVASLLCRELRCSGWSYFELNDGDRNPRCRTGDGAVHPPPLQAAADLPVEAGAALSWADLFGPDGNARPEAGTEITVLPLRRNGRIRGLYLFYRGHAAGEAGFFDQEAWKVLETVVSRTVGMNSRLLAAREKTRMAETISGFSRGLADARDAPGIFPALASCFRRYFNATAVRVRIFHEGWTGTEAPSVYYDPAELSRETAFAGDTGAAGSAVTEGIRSYRDPGSPQGSPQDDGEWVLEIPLSTGEECIGLITLRTPAAETDPLSAAQQSLIRALADEISMRILNVLLLAQAERLFHDRQKRLQELWILQETNNALRGTLKLNRILKVILAGATTEHGLGFNRAAIFLLNEKTNMLQGMLGVGPDSAAEADRIWRSLPLGEELSLSQQIEFHAENQPEHSRFNALVKSIRIPVRSGSGPLARCVSDRETLLVTGEEPPTPESELAKKLFMTNFAATPILAREQIFGVIVVDNIYDGKPITAETLRLLRMYASQAGLAIAMSKVHRSHERAVEELKVARDQLVQSERLAMLGEIAASLAHEVRNPLVTIGGFARRLTGKVDMDGTGRRYASIIAEEVQRLEKFLEEVLLFGKDRVPALHPLSVNTVIADTINLFSLHFDERGIDVKTALSQTLPAILADAQQLRQIFVNLFTNAADAMPEGGVLSVSTAESDEGSGAVRVEIADSGGGLEPEALADIFSPFFTTKKRGHGLGLALSQRIVTAHGGSMSVRNQPGAGLRFIITLPPGTDDPGKAGGESGAKEKEEYCENDPCSR